MARVTELHVRDDWGLVRLAYIPALAGSFWLVKWLPLLAAVSIRINPCFLCQLVSRWGHRVEEYYNAKPLLQITPAGLRYEDGIPPTDFEWSEIEGVVMFRRNRIPPWRTNGSTEITPPFWLSITVRKPPESTKVSSSEGGRRSFLSTDGYIEKKDYDADGEDYWTITVWPRQVAGGLFAMMRFAKELQRRLIEVADRGEIPLLLPAKNGVA